MTSEKGYLSFDPVAGDYDWTRYLPPEAQEQAARLLREEAGLSEGQILLDAGTGTGRFSLPLARLGVPVIGLDVSEKMLSQQRLKVAQDAAGEALPLRVARADLRALPLGSGAVGAALMVHILHLIADWKRVLAEIRRALAAGARSRAGPDPDRLPERGGDGGVSARAGSAGGARGPRPGAVAAAHSRREDHRGPAPALLVRSLDGPGRGECRAGRPDRGLGAADLRLPGRFRGIGGAVDRLGGEVAFCVS